MCVGRIDRLLVCVAETHSTFHSGSEWNQTLELVAPPSTLFCQVLKLNPYIVKKYMQR